MSFSCCNAIVPVVGSDVLSVCRFPLSKLHLNSISICSLV